MPTFTEPSKGTVQYTESSTMEATWKDLGNVTWEDLNGATWHDLTKRYGKKWAKPTFTETSKPSPTFTEPSKGD